MHKIEINKIVKSENPEVIKSVTEEMIIEMGKKIFEQVAYTKIPNVISASVEYNITDVGHTADETQIIFTASVDPLRDVLNTLATEYINDRQPQFEVEAETVAGFCNWVRDRETE